jgi:hypothetical protein
MRPYTLGRGENVRVGSICFAFRPFNLYYSIGIRMYVYSIRRYSHYNPSNSEKLTPIPLPSWHEPAHPHDRSVPHVRRSTSPTRGRSPRCIRCCHIGRGGKGVTLLPDSPPPSGSTLAPGREKGGGRGCEEGRSSSAAGELQGWGGDSFSPMSMCQDLCFPSVISVTS